MSKLEKQDICPKNGRLCSVMMKHLFEFLYVLLPCFYLFIIDSVGNTRIVYELYALRIFLY